jgi:DNA replication protein DnaC
MSKLQRLGQASRRFALPPQVFENLGGKATEPEATWTCEVCGPVQPRPVANGFLPGKCACQLRARAEEQRRSDWQEREAIKRRKAAWCFTWLGEVRPRNYERMTLESFQVESQMQQEALSLAFDFLACPVNLILWSKGYGSGKTHLAAAICQEMQQQGWKCLFAAALDLFRAIEARWDKPEAFTETYSDLVRQAVQADLLVLDDLARLNRYRKELDEIVDARHNRGRPTIITLNAERVQVTEQEILGVSSYIGQAASDRLCDEAMGGLVIGEMTGPSWRRRKR